jgi:general secretion pathway protein G
MHSASLPRSLRAARRAFTLLEILIALAILGMLVALAVTNLDKIFGNAQVTTAQLFTQQTMKTALTAYRINMGSYPTTAEGLQALITPPSGKEGRWGGPYITEGKIPLDPWNQPYQYAFPGNHNKNGYDVWSKGPPEKPMDIGNWEDSSNVANVPK